MMKQLFLYFLHQDTVIKLIKYKTLQRQIMLEIKRKPTPVQKICDELLIRVPD